MQVQGCVYLAGLFVAHAADHIFHGLTCQSSEPAKGAADVKSTVEVVLINHLPVRRVACKPA